MKSALNRQRIWIAAALVVVFALLVTVGKAEWSDAASAQTTGTGPSREATLEFEDDSSQAVDEVVLASVGDTAQIDITGENLDVISADEIQVHLLHDPAVTDIHSAACIDLFDSADLNVESVNGDTGAVLTCSLDDDDDIGAASGDLIRFTIERVGSGSDTISFVTDGLDLTTFFDDDVSQPTVAVATIDVPLEPAPTATPEPTATSTPSPTPTQPSGGGGGGGGGGPQPTSTPSATIVPPSAPSNVEATGADNAITITWEPPLDDGGAPVNAYFVSVFGTILFDLLPPTARSHTFEGMENGREVEVRVRAANVAGDGPYSPLIKVTPAGVPDAPGNVSAVLAGGNTIVVSWVRPKDNGASILNYTVSEIDGKLPDVEVSASSTSAVLENLAGGEYSFIVTATNSAGTGSPSSSTPALTVIEPTPSPATPTPIATTPSPTNTPVSDPTATPTPIASPGQSYSLDEATGLQVEAAFTNIYGPLMRRTGDAAELRMTGNQLELFLPFSAGLPVDISRLDLDIETDQLDLQADGSSAQISFAIASGVRVSGTGAVNINTNGTTIALPSAKFVYSPPAPSGRETFPGSAVRFEIELLNLPESPDLRASYMGELSQLQARTGVAVDEAFAAWDLKKGTLADTVALILEVSKTGLSNEQFGRTRVSFFVGDDWASNGIIADELPYIVKINDDSEVFVELARCNRAGDNQRECIAVFDGPASGFSTFALLRLAPAEGGTIRPIETVVATLEPGDPQATPTSLPLPQPTVSLPVTSANGDGLSLAVILALVVVSLLAVGFTVAGIMEYRRGARGGGTGRA